MTAEDEKWICFLRAWIESGAQKMTARELLPLAERSGFVLTGNSERGRMIKWGRLLGSRGYEPVEIDGVKFIIKSGGPYYGNIRWRIATTT